MADDEPGKFHITVIKPGRGRPRAEVAKTTLSTWLPTTHYDQIVKMANQQEKSLSAVAAEMLVQGLMRLM